MRELAKRSVPDLGILIAKGLKAGVSLKSLRSSMEPRVWMRERVKGGEVREVCLARSGRYKDYVGHNVLTGLLWLSKVLRMDKGE